MSGMLVAVGIVGGNVIIMVATTQGSVFLFVAGGNEYKCLFSKERMRMQEQMSGWRRTVDERRTKRGEGGG